MTQLAEIVSKNPFAPIALQSPASTAEASLPPTPSPPERSSSGEPKLGERGKRILQAILAGEKKDTNGSPVATAQTTEGEVKVAEAQQTSKRKLPSPDYDFIPGKPLPPHRTVTPLNDLDETDEETIRFMNKVNMNRYERKAAEAKFMGRPMPPSKHK